MRPPYCGICSRNLHDDVPKEADLREYFTLVYFRNYGVPEELAQMAGHPDGVEWFCWEHAAAAEELSHLGMGEAIDRLRERFT